MRDLTLKYDARLFINDRVDIAVAVDADGVHLGQRSLPPFSIRRLAPGLIIGVSAHSMEEAKKAQRDGADFITLGPIHPTPSKARYGAPLGLETLESVSSALHVPVFAIGGITPENMKEALERGAQGAAVISGIFAQKSVKAATMKYLRLLR
jgi:thiamine-phosphate pyrophosphorylase